MVGDCQTDEKGRRGQEPEQQACSEAAIQTEFVTRPAEIPAQRDSHGQQAENDLQRRFDSLRHIERVAAIQIMTIRGEAHEPVLRIEKKVEDCQNQERVEKPAAFQSQSGKSPGMFFASILVPDWGTIQAKILKGTLARPLLV